MSDDTGKSSVDTRIEEARKRLDRARQRVAEAEAELWSAQQSQHWAELALAKLIEVKA